MVTVTGTVANGTVPETVRITFAHGTVTVTVKWSGLCCELWLAAPCDGIADAHGDRELTLDAVGVIEGEDAGRRRTTGWLCARA
jgi:hypothetical protein